MLKLVPLVDLKTTRMFLVKLEAVWLLELLFLAGPVRAGPVNNRSCSRKELEVCLCSPEEEFSSNARSGRTTEWKDGLSCSERTILPSGSLPTPSSTILLKFNRTSALGESTGKLFKKYENSISLSREIILHMIKTNTRFFPNLLPVYDGKRNMYTKDLLPIGRDQHQFDVTLPGDSAVERQFSVMIKWASQVSLSTLDDAMEGRVRQVPFEAVQAMDVILRHLPSLK